MASARRARPPRHARPRRPRLGVWRTGFFACWLLVVAGSGGGCESLNRAVFRFNQGLDRYVIRPAVDVYEFVLPALVREGVGNVFATIGTAHTLANNLLQGKPADAVEDAARVATNLVFGLGGIFDVATAMGIPQNSEDFGQTLGTWGLGPGPYIVLPVFGPSTLRDAWDIPASVVTGPASYLSSLPARVALPVVGGLQERSEAEPLLRRRDESAVDRYAFTREAYLQRRRFLVHDGDVPEEDVLEDLDLEGVLDLPEGLGPASPEPKPASPEADTKPTDDRSREPEPPGVPDAPQGAGGES